MVSVSARPSVAVVCMWRSPRRSSSSHEPGQRSAQRRRRIRRGSREVPGGSRAARAPRRSRLPSSPATRLSSSARKRPYSLSFKPRWSARSRSDDIVRLRPGEVLLRRAEALARHQPQVGLESAPQQDARLGLAASEHALDQPVAGEHVHQAGRRAGGEDVDIAAGFAPAAQAARRWRCPRRGRMAGVSDTSAAAVSCASGISRRPVKRWRSSSAFRMSASFFGAHALQRANPAVPGGAFEIVERADVEAAVEERHGLRTDALEPQQVEDRSAETPGAVLRGTCRCRCRSAR